MNAPNVTLTDTLPANVTWAGDAFMSATSGTVTYMAGTRTLTGRRHECRRVGANYLPRRGQHAAAGINTQIVNTARVTSGAGNFTPFNLSAITMIQSSAEPEPSTNGRAATASPDST